MTQNLFPIHRAFALIVTLLANLMVAVCATTLKPEEVPQFQIRARVVTVQGAAPDEKKFSIRLDGLPGNVSQTSGSAWSDWLQFGPEQIAATLKRYPATYIGRFPVVTRLQVSGVQDATRIEAELKLTETGTVIPLHGELFGPRLGILLWRDADKTPHAATMATYNQRYWSELKNAGLSPQQRPQKFPIADRFIGGDDDYNDWREGIENLASAGFTALYIPPTKPLRKVLQQVGLQRVAGAVYAPPGYAFEFPMSGVKKLPTSPPELQEWAQKQAQPYLDAGFAPQDMALFAMSDEPGWYYPAALTALKTDADALARFQKFVQSQGLTPADVGADSWAGVLPIGRSAVHDLPSRRLFYWTMRFFPWDSARYFSTVTHALEGAFYPGMPIFTNWNYFNGRSYIPGPIANNRDKTSPDAAMGGHDWQEFSALRGGTALWTEDWFSDAQAYQWSFYTAKLSSAARQANLPFGGYVVPRASGDRPDGIEQKTLALIGGGAKALKFFTFGPEYNFPTNCYSENPVLLPRIAATNKLIARGEELLWPGQRPRAQVAIVQPRSAQMWDPPDALISDATNTDLNRDTVDYMAEVFDLYLALQHANIPTDFVSENELTAAALKPYKVLYLTSPDVPHENQVALAQWVQDGGTLVTTSNAATRDRYDQNDATLASATQIVEAPRERLLISNLEAVTKIGKIADSEIVAYGARGEFKSWKGLVRAKFEDGAPAIVGNAVGRGRAIHFAWLPGISYARASIAQAPPASGQLPSGFPATLRDWIVSPTREAGVLPPVTTNTPLVETPLLISDKGAAITALNWTGANLAQVEFQFRASFTVGEVESLKRGKLPFQKTAQGIAFQLPLDSDDIILVRPRAPR